MYPLLAIISIISTFPAFTTASCSSYSQTAMNFLNSLSMDIIKVDNKLKEVCKQFPTILPTETISQNGYKLEYTLPNYNGNFDVRIKHRVLGIIGHDPLVKVCDRTYVDMRALPDYLDGHEATWNYQYGTLTVDIPFRFKLSEVRTYCGFRIDETLIHVRKGFSSNNYGDY